MCHKLYVLRDFNFTKIDLKNPNSTFQENLNLDSDIPNSAILSHTFVRFLHSNNLSQTVAFPTRLSGSTLNLLIKPLKALSMLIKKNLLY